MCLRVSYKKKICIVLHPLSHCSKESDPDLLVRGTDPHQNVTDPQHRMKHNFHKNSLPSSGRLVN
jgi:hypothetical protein